jgi:hypothetical protein
MIDRESAIGDAGPAVGGRVRGLIRQVHCLVEEWNIVNEDTQPATVLGWYLEVYTFSILV